MIRTTLGYMRKKWSQDFGKTILEALGFFYEFFFMNSNDLDDFFGVFGGHLGNDWGGGVIRLLGFHVKSPNFT